MQTGTTPVRRGVRCLRGYRTWLDAGSVRLDAAHQVDTRDNAQVNNRARSSSDKDSPYTESRAANIKRREGRKEKGQKNRLMFEESC